MTTDPDLKSTAVFDLKQYPTEYLECREAMRHRLPANSDWRWSVLRSATGTPIEYTRTCMCLSCKAIVTDIINAKDGSKNRKVRRPTLPVQYRIPRSAGITVYDQRLELIGRFAQQAEVQIE